MKKSWLTTSRAGRVFWALLLFSALPRESLARDAYVNLEPILGWERTEADFAAPRTLYRLIYGARTVAGYKRIALEGAYFRGSLEDQVPSQEYQASESTEAFQGGLRYSHPFLSFLSLQARGGWELRKISRTQTLSGVTLAAITPWKGRPYLGVGATLRPFSFLALTAHLAAVFEDPEDLLRRVSPQLSLGLVLSPF